MATYIDGKNIRRNDLCHCGSRRKFKYCHGALRPERPQPMTSLTRIPSEVLKEIERQLRYHEAREHQRREQQGYGRPVISMEHSGYRCVAVGLGMYWSQDWRTFPDFLLYYIKKVLGDDGWGNVELSKPFERRHPLIQWYDYLCAVQRESIKVPGQVFESPMTGAVRAYLGLAYYLYLIAHNATDISSRLINRLRNPDGFRGAYYETFVAAMFINAGFELEFENEDERDSTHCEFTATFPHTGRRFSVECKARQHGGIDGNGDARAANPLLRLGKQLTKALKKRANHPRVIFIDANVPDNPKDETRLQWLQRAVLQLRRYEDRLIGGSAPAPAYVLVTNHPYTYDLTGTSFRSVVLAEGFKIPDFRADALYPSIRAAVAARERHQEMHHLLKSIARHSDFPITFDGENPELAFADGAPPRLRIGETYLVPDDGGNEVPGVLVDACVLENESKTWGIYRLANGTQVIVTNPMTEDELRAYRRHPDTFFGVVKSAKREAKDALDLYDFMYESYRNTPKARLLEFMHDHPDIKELDELPQDEIAKIYCERIALAVDFQANKSQQQTENEQAGAASRGPANPNPHGVQ